MLVFRPLSIAILLGLLAGSAIVTSASAADGPRRVCLTKAEQPAAVATHRAVSLARVIKSMREHGRRVEVLRAELCHRGNGLVYVLTLLARNGKVTRATVNAAGPAQSHGMAMALARSSRNPGR